MKPEIQKQKELMQEALYLLNEIERFEGEPPTIAGKNHSKFLKDQYAETMATLAGELASVGKVNVIIHEEIKY